MGTKPELKKPKSWHMPKPASQNMPKPALENNTEPLFLENCIKRLNHPISVKQSGVYLVTTVLLAF